MHGADDPVIPAAAGKDTAESIPGAELIIVPGMGHDFPSALVPIYLKHIGDFVAKVEAHGSLASRQFRLLRSNAGRDPTSLFAMRRPVGAPWRILAGF